MRFYCINGTRLLTPKAFYAYTANLLISNLSWTPSSNLDAFAELLEGGFGKHDLNESIHITWINMHKSREVLPARFLRDVIEILRETKHVTLEVKEFDP